MNDRSSMPSGRLRLSGRASRNLRRWHARAGCLALSLVVVAGCGGSGADSAKAAPTAAVSSSPSSSVSSTTPSTAATAGSTPAASDSTTPAAAAASPSPAPSATFSFGTATGTDGLWDSFPRQPGLGEDAAGDTIGPLFGSPLLFTTVGSTTTITTIKATPAGNRCEGHPAPAGTVIGTFSTTGSPHAGKVSYWNWEKCVPDKFYPWTVQVAKDSTDKRPLLEGTLGSGHLSEFFQRCLDGVATVDPKTHNTCDDTP